MALSAPLEPNVNHRSTVFGGSCASVAILAAWTLAHLRVQATGSVARVVIQRGTTEYRLPIEGAFVATCDSPGEPAWDRFVRALRRRGQARIELEATVTSDGVVVATFSGAYVAIVTRPDGGTGAAGVGSRRPAVMPGRLLSSVKSRLSQARAGSASLQPGTEDLEARRCSHDPCLTVRVGSPKRVQAVVSSHRCCLANPSTLAAPRPARNVSGSHLGRRLEPHVAGRRLGGDEAEQPCPLLHHRRLVGR